MEKGKKQKKNRAKNLSYRAGRRTVHLTGRPLGMRHVGLQWHGRRVAEEAGSVAANLEVCWNVFVRIHIDTMNSSSYHPPSYETLDLLWKG